MVHKLGAASERKNGLSWLFMPEDRREKLGERRESRKTNSGDEMRLASMSLQVCGLSKALDHYRSLGR